MTGDPAGDYLRVLCTCKHPRGWHDPTHVASNVPLEWLMKLHFGECRHPGCSCPEFTGPPADSK